jgi:hypothetical protein
VTHGARALTCDTGGVVALWDLAAPGLLRTLDVEREANGRPMALGEDVALTAESAGFAVWDAATGELRRRVPCQGHGTSPTPHALAPLSDGRVLVGFLGEGLALCGPGEGEAQPLTGDTQQVSILAVSPDERYAVSSGYFERAEDRARADRKAGGGTCTCRACRTCRAGTWRRARCCGPSRPAAASDYIDFVFCLFTPDGRLVTRSGEDERELAFWDPRTGAVVQTVELPGNYPVATRLAGRDLVMLVFEEADKTADGRPCTAVRIDLATGEVTHRRALGRLPMNAAFSPDGSRLARPARARWTCTTRPRASASRSYACGARVRELSFSDDGQRIVLGDEAGRVHVLTLDGWEPTTAEAVDARGARGAAARDRGARAGAARAAAGPQKVDETCGGSQQEVGAGSEAARRAREAGDDEETGDEAPRCQEEAGGEEEVRSVSGAGCCRRQPCCCRRRRGAPGCWGSSGCRDAAGPPRTSRCSGS